MDVYLPQEMLSATPPPTVFQPICLPFTDPPHTSADAWVICMSDAEFTGDGGSDPKTPRWNLCTTEERVALHWKFLGLEVRRVHVGNAI